MVATLSQVPFGVDQQISLQGRNTGNQITRAYLSHYLHVRAEGGSGQEALWAMYEDNRPEAGLMRIGVNLLPYSPGAHGGAEVYLSNVVAALSKVATGDDLVVIVGGTAARSYSGLGQRLRTVSIPVPWPRSRFARSLAEQAILPITCAKQRLDCIVSNYIIPLLAPCPKVVIVHDMLYCSYPQVFERTKLIYWRLMIPASIRRSASVVTVSHFSREEIIAFFPSIKNEIFVTVEGIRPSLASAIGSEVPCRLKPQEYLLCVATFGKHKNLHILLRAFASLPPEHSNLSLAFVGAARTPDAQEYRASLKTLAIQLGLSSRVVFMDHMSDAELAGRYRNASALVLPSLYEGFGLPVIEAQYFGCPVLCSNAASLPEIAGSAAIYFEPTSAESIRDAIVTVINHPEQRERLRQLGYENVSRFTWEKAAAQLMEAIDFAVQSNA